ncbi:MAG: DUF3105 domain-containing protein [Anaerolineaceae bacterium]|nr:DUF3105 domain-containing protein [Anaerolineaceae bacterium]
MKKHAIREQRRREQKKRQLRIILTTAGVILVLILLFAFLFYQNYRPFTGTQIPIAADAGNHVPDGQDPGPYTSTPPSSGRHYDTNYIAGFYETSDPETETPYPEGYLLHSLEHGYVVFWYNCEIVSADECETLKSKIKDVINSTDGLKLIAFPYGKMDVPAAMTSWGYLQEFERFDPALAKRFIRTNRYRAPEPHGQ